MDYLSLVRLLFVRLHRFPSEPLWSFDPLFALLLLLIPIRRRKFNGISHVHKYNKNTHTHTHRREARGQSPNVESSLTPITRSVTFFSLSLPPVGSSVWSLLQQHTRTRDKNKTWNWAITNIFLMFVCFVKLTLGIFLLLLLLLLPLICQRLQKYKSSAPDNK